MRLWVICPFGRQALRNENGSIMVWDSWSDATEYVRQNMGAATVKPLDPAYI